MIHGLRTGTYQLTKGDSTFSGIVRDANGRIVGHLRFEAASRVAAGTAIAFHLASVVTLQYYLHEINARLDRVVRQLHGIRSFMESRADAELDSADHLLVTAVERLFHGSGDDSFSVQVTHARSHAATGYAHSLRIVSEVGESMKRALAGYREAAAESKRLQSLRRGGLKAQLVEAVGLARENVDSAIRLLRSTQLLERLDVLEALASDDPGAEYRRVRAGWHQRLSEVDGALAGFSVGLELSDETLRPLFVREGALISGLAEYRSVVNEIARLHEALVSVSNREVEIAAVDIVNSRQGHRAVAVELS